MFGICTFKKFLYTFFVKTVFINSEINEVLLIEYSVFSSCKRTIKGDVSDGRINTFPFLFRRGFQV